MNPLTIVEIDVAFEFTSPDNMVASGNITVLGVCMDGESDDLTQQVEVIAAVGAAMMAMWEQHWRPDQKKMTAQFDCLRNKVNVTADTKQLPYKWVVDAARSLLLES